MSGVRERKRSWQIWWLVTLNGTTAREWATLSKREYSCKKDAVKEARKRESLGECPIDKEKTFAQATQAFLSGKHVASSTLRRYELVIKSFNKFLLEKYSEVGLPAINEQMVNAYIGDKRLRYGAAGVNFDIRFLKEFFKNAIEKRLLERSPLTNIKYLREERKVRELPTDEERVRIVNWFQKNEPLFFPWIYFEATRGWRRDELRLMRINDLDLRGNMLYVRNTKTKEQRMAQLSAEDCLVLNEHLIFLRDKKRYHPTGPLFPTKNLKFQGRDVLLEKIKEACRKLKIEKNITNHSFRHYVVTKITNETSNLEAVKAITGHKDTRTIMEHYVHPSTEIVNKALQITRIDTGLISEKLREDV